MLFIYSPLLKIAAPFHIKFYRFSFEYFKFTLHFEGELSCNSSVNLSGNPFKLVYPPEISKFLYMGDLKSLSI